MAILRELLFLGSYLCFPFILWMFFRLYEKPQKALSVTLIGLSCLFIWVRFIEPHKLIVNHVTIPFDHQISIALISDPHLGVYKNSSLLKKAVAEINKHDIDIVLIAGDFTLDPDEAALYKLLSPLKSLVAPTYAVLGNHDVEKPGPNIRGQLTLHLETLGVNVLNNDIVLFSGFTLVGLGAHSNQEDDVTLLKGLTHDKTIVLTHNPDTTLLYGSGHSAAITFAGHTHCGQVRIPTLYKSMIPTVGDFDGGLSTETYTKLYITCGIGETLLPIRFLNPPAIDIIDLSSNN